MKHQTFPIVRGDASFVGPGDPLRVLREDASGLSVPPPIAPAHQPPTFDKARDRDEYHYLQTLPHLDSEAIKRRRAYQLKYHRKMMALLVELHTQQVA